MSEMRDTIQDSYSWTAYMKLKGQTWARREDEILDEFEGFVQSLRGAGLDYNIIVVVERRVPRQHRSECTAGDIGAKIAREGPGA